MEEYITQYRYALVDEVPVREEVRYILAGTLNNNVNDARNITAKQAGISGDINPETKLFKYIIINNLADDSQKDTIEWFGNQYDLKLKPGVTIISEKEYNTMTSEASKNVAKLKEDKTQQLEESIYTSLGYKDQADYEERRVKPLKEYYTKQARLTELQDKAVLEGLTEEEKQEYKELRGL